MGSRPRNLTRARKARSLRTSSQRTPAHSLNDYGVILRNLSIALTGVSKAAASGDAVRFRDAVRVLRNACITAELILAKAVRS